MHYLACANGVRANPERAGADRERSAESGECSAERGERGTLDAGWVRSPPFPTGRWSGWLPIVGRWSGVLFGCAALPIHVALFHGHVRPSDENARLKEENALLWTLVGCAPLAHSRTGVPRS